MFFFKTHSFQRTFVLALVKDICYLQHSFGSVFPSLIEKTFVFSPATQRKEIYPPTPKAEP